MSTRPAVGAETAISDAQVVSAAASVPTEPLQVAGGEAAGSVVAGEALAVGLVEVALADGGAGAGLSAADGVIDVLAVAAGVIVAEDGEMEWCALLPTSLDAQSRDAAAEGRWAAGTGQRAHEGGGDGEEGVGEGGRWDPEEGLVRGAVVDAQLRLLSPELELDVVPAPVAERSVRELPAIFFQLHLDSAVHKAQSHLGLASAVAEDEDGGDGVCLCAPEIQPDGERKGETTGAGPVPLHVAVAGLKSETGDEGSLSAILPAPAGATLAAVAVPAILAAHRALAGLRREAAIASPTAARLTAASLATDGLRAEICGHPVQLHVPKTAVQTSWLLLQQSAVLARRQTGEVERPGEVEEAEAVPTRDAGRQAKLRCALRRVQLPREAKHQLCRTLVQPQTQHSGGEGKVQSVPASVVHAVPGQRWQTKAGASTAAQRNVNLKFGVKVGSDIYEVLLL